MPIPKSPEQLGDVVAQLTPQIEDGWMRAEDKLPDTDDFLAIVDIDSKKLVIEPRPAAIEKLARAIVLEHDFDKPSGKGAVDNRLVLPVLLRDRHGGNVSFRMTRKEVPYAHAFCAKCKKIIPRRHNEAGMIMSKKGGEPVCSRACYNELLIERSLPS